MASAAVVSPLGCDRWSEALAGQSGLLPRNNEGFWKVLTSPGVSKNTVALIIDEYHCISQWGGEFRTSYSLLEKLRGFVPLGTPILATTVMLIREARDEVYRVLQINPSKSFILNLGNDCRNIKPLVCYINSEADLAALDFIVPLGTQTPASLLKTLVYVDLKLQSLMICQYLHDRLLDELKDQVDYFNTL